ncbi:MAG: 30S ribosomal protein S17 [Candidatus Dependentiae bacterium]|nr:30S ribosomal protein S17 [Candidatus Dependentiae bacterium]
METKRKLMLGEVVSDKMDKTIVVKYVRSFKHEKFNKIVKKTTKYKVHDEQALAKIGDTVEFYIGAPKSKTKFMYLHRIVK